jgi:hypothetical protein
MASSLSGLKSLQFFCVGPHKTIGVRRTCEQCRETSFSRRKCRKTIREMPGIFGRMSESWLRRRRAVLKCNIQHVSTAAIFKCIRYRRLFPEENFLQF